MSRIAREIKTVDATMKTCSACGKTYPSIDFENGRNQCKYCRDKVKHPKVIETTDEYMNRIRLENKIAETQSAIGQIAELSQKITEEGLSNFNNSLKNKEKKEMYAKLRYMIANVQRAINICEKYLTKNEPSA